jgi:phosphatidylserine decarboxylase
MWIESPRARVALVLIADKFVSKITTFAKEGSAVKAGEKISFIGRGSQVDVVVCGQSLVMAAEVGQAVRGPDTVLAQFAD